MVAENRATWGRAERVVSAALDEFFVNQDRAVTDPDKMVCGWSLERQIAEALREAGLLTQEVIHREDTEDSAVPAVEDRGENRQGEEGRQGRRSEGKVQRPHPPERYEGGS